MSGSRDMSSHCNDALRAGYRKQVPTEPAHAALHARAREKGVNPLVYWLVRAVLQPVFHLYFRLSRIGREHIPESGPVILCSNHRSFLDPFVIGTCLRRPVYYVAKQELFSYRLRRLDPQLARARSRSSAAPATRTCWPPRRRSSSAATRC